MGIEQSQHEDFMSRALSLALKAESESEVPVGAVVVYQNEILAEGYNQTIQLSDPTAHAEIIALRRACQEVDNYRLIDAVMYTSLEPCCMCAGALVHARIKKVFYAASDPRAGACGSQFQLANNQILNHRIDLHQGLFQQQSSEILKNFFKKRRL